MGLKNYYNENNVEVLCFVVVNDYIVRTSPVLLCPLTSDLTATSDNNIMTCQPSTAEGFRTYRNLKSPLPPESKEISCWEITIYSGYTSRKKALGNNNCRALLNR